MEEQIGGFDIAVDNSQAVRVAECLGNLADIIGDGVKIKLFALAFHLIDAFAQRTSANIGHNKVRQLLSVYYRLVILVHWQNILMFQPGDRIGFAPETL